MSKNWLNLRFSVGIIPYLYMLCRFGFKTFDLCLWCFGYDRKYLSFVLRDEPTLLGAADMKLSTVDWPGLNY